ncbi:Vigilin [Blattella germanica]|nr:Vigilin [Blattella germanica]
MQQTVMEKEAAYEPPTYDEVFPALPESFTSASPTVNQLGQWNNKMRIGSSVVTQVFRVPHEERKFDHSDKFGEGESLRTCARIMKETDSRIEISSSKDMSLTFLVTGKQNAVLEARRKILANFQTQNGTKLRELEKTTATKISVPNMNDDSNKITITGTKEGIEKASKQGYERLTIPKIYHPFICGANNENVTALMNETGVRINIPPPSVQNEEITVAGEKEGEKKCTTVSVEVPSTQHKYVIGQRRSTLAEILQTTGVSVEVPPSHSRTSTITLRGPQDKLGSALTMVYEKASSVREINIEAPSWTHKHIIGPKGLHVEFIEDIIKIGGPPEEVEKAQSRLEECLSSLSCVKLTVDPKHYKHIIGKSGANVNRIKNEYQVDIDMADDGHCDIISIQGKEPDVERAKQEVEEIVRKLENEKEKDIIIDHRHYRTIIGNKGDKIREIREQFNQVLITFPNQGDTCDVVKIRGPKDDVDKCHKHLLKFVKNLDENSHVISVPIDKQLHKYIIGKNGVTIRKGEKSDVITITGTKSNALKAKDMIEKMKDDLAKFVTEEIVIPPKFYNSLIGAGGKLIQSISDDCGGVAIKFPQAESHSDKVTVRGPKEDVKRAIQQLQELTNERQLSSFSAEVRAKPQHHKFLIGKSGCNIKKIRDSTGARIIFPSEGDEDKEAITINGRQDAVEKAKAELEALIKDIDNTVESVMSVEPRHHRHFVARRGEVLNRISDECGSVSISFPRPEDQSDRVQLKGAKECIELAKQRIQEIVTDLESMVTIECIIPQKHHRSVMGQKGHNVQDITKDFNVQIKFPDRNAQEYHNHQEESEQQNGELEDHEPVRMCDVIRITGKQENCELAKQALLDLVPITVEVNVPFDFHRSIIGQKGNNVRDLMNRYDVHILMSPADQHLDIIKISGAPADVEQARIAVEERCKEIEIERQDRLLKSYELTVEVDPELHYKIIGRKGEVITEIRKRHGVQFNFPKKGDPDEHIITIKGYEKDAHAARDDIMKIVDKWNNMIKEEVHIDARVHSRLIGARGRNIRKIMEQFEVDIKFPRNSDVDPNIVTIIGNEDNVLDAKEHLLNLEEEYMQDVTEAVMRESYRPSSSRAEDDDNGFGLGVNAPGFVVKGGPWEQRAPDTTSTSEFPSFGNSGEAAQNVPPPSGVWGPRR